MSSSKTEFVMSKETDKIADISNIQLMSSLPSSLAFETLGKMINTLIKSTLTDKPWPPTPDAIILTKQKQRSFQFNMLNYILVDNLMTLAWLNYPNQKLRR